MIYLTPDTGKALGILLKEANKKAEIVLTSESLTLKIGEDESSSEQIKSSPKKRGGMPKTVTCGGETLTVKQWAEKLGVSTNVIYARLRSYGSPYGKNDKPSDSDSMVMAGAELITDDPEVELGDETEVNAEE